MPKSATSIKAGEANIASLFTQEQAAEFLGLEPRTLEAWRARGSYALPFVKIGPRIVRYRRADLEKWIERQVVKHEPAMA